jgi:hypothetical protein
MVFFTSFYIHMSFKIKTQLVTNEEDAMITGISIRQGGVGDICFGIQGEYRFPVRILLILSAQGITGKRKTICIFSKLNTERCQTRKVPGTKNS